MPMGSASLAISPRDGESLPVRCPATGRNRSRRKPARPEQYQVFDTPEYSYRVFVTNIKQPIDLLVWFYSQRGRAENLIQPD
jgi:hypothetical protein